MGKILLRPIVLLALFPSVALAQRVTKVTSGDEVVIEGVGKVHLMGVLSADGPALQNLKGGAAPQQPTSEAYPVSPPLIGGTVGLTRDRPSRDFLRELVLGKTVRIKYDSLAGGKDRAYLFLEDGKLVNAELIRTGHARVDLSRAFEHEAEFKRLEDEARRAELGIWISIR